MNCPSDLAAVIYFINKYYGQPGSGLKGYAQQVLSLLKRNKNMAYIPQQPVYIYFMQNPMVAPLTGPSPCRILYEETLPLYQDCCYQMPRYETNCCQNYGANCYQGFDYCTNDANRYQKYFTNFDQNINACNMYSGCYPNWYQSPQPYCTNQGRLVYDDVVPLTTCSKRTRSCQKSAQAPSTMIPIKSTSGVELGSNLPESFRYYPYCISCPYYSGDKSALPTHAFSECNMKRCKKCPHYHRCVCQIPIQEYTSYQNVAHSQCQSATQQSQDFCRCEK